MSVLNQKKAAANLASITTKAGAYVDTAMTTQKITSAMTDEVLTMESAFAKNPESPSLNNLQSKFSDLSAGFKSIFSSEEAKSVLGYEVSDVNLESAVITAMAMGDIGAYRNKLSAMTNAKVSVGANEIMASPYLSGANGAVEFSPEYLNNESFSTENIQAAYQYNVFANMSATLQSPFAEGLYKTIVRTPEEPAIIVECSRGVVYAPFTYKGDNSKLNFGFKNLLDGVTDHTILVSNDTKLVPYKRAETAAVLDAVVEWTETIGETDVLTAPYLFNKQIGYIDTSFHPTLYGSGLLNDTDQIDAYIPLDKVFVEFDDGTDTAIVAYKTGGLPNARYVPQYEGEDRDMFLNFKNSDFTVTGATKQWNTTTDLPTDMATAIGTNVVHFRINVNGDINLNQNGGKLIGGIEVIRITAADGTGVVGSAYDTIVAALGTISLRSYSLDARRDNGNHRTRGRQITSHSVREMFRVYTNPPLSIAVPRGDAAAASAVLRELSNGLRMRNDSNAVTQALNYLEMIKPHAEHPIGTIPSIQGSGRWYCPVFHDDLPLDLTAALTSTNSTDRAQNVTSTILNYCSDIANRLLARTRYTAAARYLGSENVKFFIQLTCDPELRRYINRFGDPRLLGADVESRVEECFDSRWEGLIHLTVVRPSAGDIDPLSHGNFLVIPEVSSVIQKSIDNATVDEVKINTRTLHMNNFPGAAVIRVNMDQLREGLKLATAIPFNEV